MRFFGILGRRFTKRRAGGMKARLSLETLEMRALMSVDLFAAIDGTNQGNSSCGCTPPDTSGAAGPNQVIETVNSAFAVYDKNSGALINRRSLASLFAPLGGVQSLSDPVAMYDDINGQFVLGVLDYNQGARLSRFDLAVSNDSDPADGFYVQRYNMQDGIGSFDFADYPKAGYNADAYVFSFNMFPNGGAFHVSTLAVDKNSLQGFLHVVPGNHATMTPASMHQSNSGDPMWFVESNQGGSSSMKVVRMTNILSNSPTYTVTNVGVPSYSTNAPNPPQPGGSAISLSPDDGRVFDAAYYGGLLVGSHTISSGGRAQARWYEFDTTTASPSLVQAGNVDQGAGVATFFPTIDINYNYDLGITFMESSSSEFLSMYVTGQSVNDYGSGTVQTPVQVFAGTSRYTSSRIGDYSGVNFDPADGYSFWAFNQYKGNSTWNTGIGGFGVSPNSGAPNPGLGQAGREIVNVAPAATPVAPAAFTPERWSADLGTLLLDGWNVTHTAQPEFRFLTVNRTSGTIAPDNGLDLIGQEIVL